MSEKKRKALYWTFKILSVIISCALPIFAVCEHFPVWTTSYGTVKSIGAGTIISLVVVVIVFRKAVISFVKEKLKIEHAPPVVIWLVLLIISYVLMYIHKFLGDLNAVFWMGLVGCAIGTVLTYIAEHKFAKKKEEENDGNGGA